MDNKKSPWAKRKTLFIKLLKGVSHAHKTNVIHRDLKPQNVLITADDNPKIIDFGLAKFKDKSITVTGDFAGTLPYADPEAFLSGIKYVDARCDIYALGIMLYEMVMGANPWTLNGFEYGEFIRYIIEGKTNLLEIDRAYKFNEDATIKGVIEKATSFDSAHRITTVNDMISLLGDAPEIRKPITVDFSIASPVLIVEDGSAKGAMNVLTIPDGGSKLLGRHNLDATNGTISKNHAVISRKGNKYFIYDDNSSNGTFVGGNKLKPGEEYLQEIKHTDRIRFADLWTRFVFLKRD
jgi:serine/threonine-protein kinase